ncbi:MAG: uroporphyrinogen decarboxylase family protein [Clostridia bacterium]|nr:uroporphyrinogen decarboxylase family protein [Clostridia bacterium]
MTHRERVIAALEFRETDRIPKYDSFWQQTVALYKESGLDMRLEEKPVIEVDGLTRTIGNPIEDYFDFDFDLMSIDTSLRMPYKVLSEEDEFIVICDHYGYTVKKFKDKSCSMHFLDHVTKDHATWNMLKSRMVFDENDTSRLDSVSYFLHEESYPSWGGFKRIYDEYRKRGKYMLYTCYGPWEGTWRHRGFMELMMDSALDPEWTYEMMEYHMNLAIDSLKHAVKIGAKPDGIYLVEDLGGTHTTLISVDAYRQFIKPHHKKMADYCHANGIKVFMHSCGKIESFIPDFIEAGIDVLQALQANTGMDVVKLKEKYGDSIVFFGNIAEAALAGTKEDIRREIEYKVGNAKRGGGYIYHSDHSVPDEVSFENYEYAMQMVEKYGSYK